MSQGITSIFLLTYIVSIYCLSAQPPTVRCISLPVGRSEYQSIISFPLHRFQRLHFINSPITSSQDRLRAPTLSQNITIRVSSSSSRSASMAPNSLHPPPSVVASWPHPNYVSPDTRGPGLTVIGILLSAIALLLVLARLWSRLFITRAPGLDDLFAVFALAGEIGLLGLIIGSKCCLRLA